MAARDFQPVFSTTSAPVAVRPPPILQGFLKDSFKLSTLFAIGAFLQTIVISVLPARYALIPLALVIGRSIILTITQARSPKDNVFTLDIVPGRVTAQLPSRAGGAFGSTPAAQPLVVFHLGVRFNHPLGLLSPGAKEMGDFFKAMTDSLEAKRDEYGLLHFNTWRATDRATNNSIMMIAYFRDVDALNKFAHDKVHRDGWDWYHRFAKKEGNSHIGIFHETFITRPGDYETIYVDCPPTLLGAANVKVESEDEKVSKGEETWTRPLVSADHPALRSQSKRMGMTLSLEGDADMY